MTTHKWLLLNACYLPWLQWKSCNIKHTQTALKTFEDQLYSSEEINQRRSLKVKFAVCVWGFPNKIMVQVIIFQHLKHAINKHVVHDNSPQSCW